MHPTTLLKERGVHHPPGRFPLSIIVTDKWSLGVRALHLGPPPGKASFLVRRKESRRDLHPTASVDSPPTCLLPYTRYSEFESRIYDFADATPYMQGFLRAGVPRGETC